MRNIADGEEYQVPSTIEDPVTLTEIREVLADRTGGIQPAPVEANGS
jgi:hypothetical protein